VGGLQVVRGMAAVSLGLSRHAWKSTVIDSRGTVVRCATARDNVTSICEFGR